MFEEPSAFDRIKATLRRIPFGTVTTYGEVAARSGIARGSRTVVWVLKTCAEKETLPWHRVVRKDGNIAIKNPDGWHLQKALLESEGVEVSENGQIDLERFAWKN